MREIDYRYIADSISNLSRISIRIYRDGELIYYVDPAAFPKDPAGRYIDSFLKIEAKVSYFISEADHFYGIVKQGNTTMVLGPTYQIIPPRDKIREFMYELGIKNDFVNVYTNFLQYITPLPLEMFLQELCMIYYFVSDEKLNIPDIFIFDTNASIPAQNKRLDFPEEKGKSDPPYEYTEAADHTTVFYEKTMLEYIRNGNTEGLTGFFKNFTAGKAGKVASTYLRQVKNIFITTATLVSRAAIDGGLSTEEALSLSDNYIQHAESYSNQEQILNLQFNMIMDYASRVHDIKEGKTYDKFLSDVTKYIQNHLTEDIVVEDIATSVGLSKSYLSAKFAKEMGMPLSEYIQKQKINKAKNLLKTTNISLLDISTYLGYSSQGYFTNVFRKQVGMTPKKYRNMSCS